MTTDQGYLASRHGRVEWTAPSAGMRTDKLEVVVNISASHAVIIDKLFGPWAVDLIRVSLDYENADWVIEQRSCNATWIEVARFPADVDNREDKERWHCDQCHCSTFNNETAN